MDLSEKIMTEAVKVITEVEQKMTEEIKQLKLENELKLRELSGIEVELTAGDFSLDVSDCRRLTFDVPNGIELPPIRLGDKWAIRPLPIPSKE